MQVSCPVCSEDFPVNIIEEHAANCMGATQETANLGAEKHPSETYSQYYSRLGCNKVAEKPIKHDVPAHLK